MASDTQAIHDWLRQHDITEVECTVPDITGNARGKFIPIDQFLKEEPRLPESILIQSVTGEYSAEHWSFVEPTDADMLLKPDASTLRVVPWARESTAQIIHNCYSMVDGKPHPLSTRNVLRKVLDLYAADGLRPVVAPEVEFFLVAKNVDPNNELTPPIGRSGRAETSRQSYSMDAVSEFEDFVEDMYAYAEAQELDVDALIHENGAAQMEVNFLHGDPMNLADQVFAFKRTVRETAHKHGIYATFMAKPTQKECGSAMHIHQSLVRVDSGENIFADENGGHTPEFLSYIAGLQQYTPELISLYAPNVNSYRRLAPDISAPINLNWGLDNRTTAFRVPNSNRAGTRVENRFPGADVNPYLAFAATLASGYLGMKKKLKPSKPHQGTANEASVEVARSLEEGLRHLQDTPELVAIFGELFLRAYSAVKLNEFEEFNRVISSWEREHLLLQV